MAHGKFKDFQEEQILINYYVIKHLILLKIQNMTDIKQVLLLWFRKFWINFGSAIKSETMSTNSHKLIISEVEEKKHSFINNYIWCADLVYMELRSNITKEFNFYYGLFIFIVDMKQKEILQLLIFFKIF